MKIKRDSFSLGAILGILGPLFGTLIFKWVKFRVFSFTEVFQFMYTEPGHKTITVALSLALLVNALLFTLCINTHTDKTAKGIFIVTCIYGLLVLGIKTFG